MPLGILNYTQLGELFNRSAGTAYRTPPIVSQEITSTFSEITTPTNTVGDDVVSTYVVQNLVPNRTYTLRFKLSKKIGAVWTNVLDGTGSTYLDPAAVVDLADSKTSGDTGEFWWSTMDTATRQLMFKTGIFDGMTITPSKFSDVRQVGSSGEYNTPSQNSEYNSFDGPKSFPLLTNGRPDGGFSAPIFPAVPNEVDGYLFIFEKSTTPYTDPNVHFTDRFTAGDFVGRVVGDNSKGYLRIPQINSKAGGIFVHEVGFTEAMFTTIGQPFYTRSGAGLDSTKIYKAALLLVNVTAEYIVQTDKLDGSSGRVIKWFVADIPVGGVWSISLGRFLNLSGVNTQLSPSTAVAVSIDGIGVAGSIGSNDDFRIEIIAEPNT
jgi:hypothetical protein